MKTLVNRLVEDPESEHGSLRALAWYARQHAGTQYSVSTFAGCLPVLLALLEHRDATLADDAWTVLDWFLYRGLSSLPSTRLSSTLEQLATRLLGLAVRYPVRAAEWWISRLRGGLYLAPEFDYAYALQVWREADLDDARKVDVGWAFVASKHWHPPDNQREDWLAWVTLRCSVDQLPPDVDWGLCRRGWHTHATCPSIAEWNPVQYSPLSLQKLVVGSEGGWRGEEGIRAAWLLWAHAEDDFGFLPRRDDGFTACDYECIDDVVDTQKPQPFTDVMAMMALHSVQAARSQKARDAAWGLLQVGFESQSETYRSWLKDKHGWDELFLQCSKHVQLALNYELNADRNKGWWMVLNWMPRVVNRALDRCWFPRMEDWPDVEIAVELGDRAWELPYWVAVTQSVTFSKIWHKRTPGNTWRWKPTDAVTPEMMEAFVHWCRAFTVHETVDWHTQRSMAEYLQCEPWKRTLDRALAEVVVDAKIHDDAVPLAIEWADRSPMLTEAMLYVLGNYPSNAERLGTKHLFMEAFRRAVLKS